MIQIFNEKFSGLKPIYPTFNTLCVFNLHDAKIAFNYTPVEFVFVLNEETGKFARCYNVNQVQEYLENE